MSVPAAVLVAPGRYELREYPEPQLEPGAALIRIELSGICGTDKHTFQGYTSQYGGAAQPSSTPFPIIQGHENVGTVAETNGVVRDFEGRPLEPGTRVVVGPNLTCGRCRVCALGLPYTLCESVRDYGNTITAADPPHLFGGWARYLYAAPGSYLFRVPDDLPSGVAVLAEVLAATVGLDRARQTSTMAGEPFALDDSVAVYGVGPLGLLHVVKARMLGAGRIVALDLSAARLDYAVRLGADAAVDVSGMVPTEVVAAVRDLTGGGADVVVEAAGVPEVVPTAIDALRPGGLLVEVGNFSDLGEVALSPHRHLCSKGIRLIGVPGQEPSAYGPGMRQLARYRLSHPLDEFVSHRFGLADAERAVHTAVNPASLKVVLDPWRQE